MDTTLCVTDSRATDAAVRDEMRGLISIAQRILPPDKLDILLDRVRADVAASKTPDEIADILYLARAEALALAPARIV